MSHDSSVEKIRRLKACTRVGAVALAPSRGRTISRIAPELGVSHEILRQWSKSAEMERDLLRRAAEDFRRASGGRRWSTDGGCRSGPARHIPAKYRSSTTCPRAARTGWRNLRFCLAAAIPRRARRARMGDDDSALTLAALCHEGGGGRHDIPL
ncbi:transposase [Streptomyces sp. NPDC006739]|uniref:transposase n=1 Tax=Streptomyces sp. NPDC006739 TaxID=3364763 RepID=UPI0036B0E21C